MSLYGSGRGEGIGAAAIIAAFVLLVHWLAAAAADVATTDTAQRLLHTALPALGGALCYRFLRAQGRRRYAAFLVGIAYGSSPWLAALAQAPRELVAAALAPLALEAACHFDRPSQRRAWLPWSWICIAAPFVAGNTIIAWLCVGMCMLALVRTVVCGDRDANLPSLRLAVWTAGGAMLAAVHFCWLDLLAPSLGGNCMLTSSDVLALHRGGHGLDAAAALRVAGPMLLLFAGLGLLRHQRHVDKTAWLAIAIAGALPSLLHLVPSLAKASPLLADLSALAAPAWWLTLLGMVVLATAGLDDFLDMPLRRRTALPWLLALSVVAAALLPVLGARSPEREWPLTLGLPTVAALLFTWRRLGILQFKNLLAIAALVVTAVPLLQSLPTLSARAALQSALPPAAPIGDVQLSHATSSTHPSGHYFGLLAALALTVLLATIDRWRVARAVVPMPSRRGAAVKPKHRR